jgi:hypothetical protein
MEDLQQRIADIANSPPSRGQLAELLNLIQNPTYYKYYDEIKDLLQTLPETFKVPFIAYFI